MKNIKRIGYLIVVGLAVLLIIAATGGNDLPMILSFGVGTILALIGIALAIWETKTDKPMFYSYGKNWFGGYLNNSAFILGIFRNKSCIWIYSTWDNCYAICNNYCCS